MAYLVNRYPDYSHSFIRREILALENGGNAIERFTIRPPRTGLVDPADQDEATRVHVILKAGMVRLAWDTIRLGCERPRRFAGALSVALMFLRRARRRPVAHMAYLVEACHLVRRLEAGSATILHAHFGTNPATVALLARELGGPPVIMTVHGPEEFVSSERIGLTEKVDRAAATIAVCRHGAEILRRTLRPGRVDPVHVVHCGIDGEHLAGPADLPAEARIICVGRLCEQKDQLLLLEALRLLADRGIPCSLDLLGDGPWRRRLEHFVARHGLGDRVSFHGWQPGARVARLMRASRALVLSSRAEGLPLVIMESFAAGRPVIATAVGGVPELVDATTGWLVPSGNATRLAEAIHAALVAPDEIILAMGARGRSRVERDFDSGLIADELRSIHESVTLAGRAEALDGPVR